ncbi:MAG: cupin domain-containing protein [Treponema sp.]|jgi:mannose-6-phosphate isomerase-like protein (cupin superfamily)|nr:cupin domain-containing protein [Treponema sp.]
MIVRRDGMKVESKERMRNGEGTAVLTHFVEGGAQKNIRLAAEIALDPGSSIGCHPHEGETEYFVFLEGTGRANDNGTDVPVKKGDVMITGNGAYHGVSNTGTGPLVFNAFIVTH